MTQPADLSWMLLWIGAALWSLPSDHGRIDRPTPLTALAACGLAGLYCVLVGCAAAG